MGRYTYLMLSVSMCVHYLPIMIRNRFDLPDSMSLGKLATYSSSFIRVMGMNWRAMRILPFLLQMLALITTIIIFIIPNHSFA